MIYAIFLTFLKNYHSALKSDEFEELCPYGTHSRVCAQYCLKNIYFLVFQYKALCTKVYFHDSFEAEHLLCSVESLTVHTYPFKYQKSYTKLLLESHYHVENIITSRLLL